LLFVETINVLARMLATRIVARPERAYTSGMARLDKIHNAVKNALVKDGWDITDDPYTIPTPSGTKR
jgi:hypothetical protein